MANHMWVSFTYIPLIVEQGPNNTIQVSMAESAAETALDEALLGCWFCYTPLNSETFNTECSHS